jgi:carbamate kinase
LPERILVALGGNALLRNHDPASIEIERANLQASLGGVVELIRRGHEVVITHGNGPQVGAILIRVEHARGKTYDLPLDVCVAESQGELGYLIQQSLENLLLAAAIPRLVATVVTRVVVDRNDPRLTKPSKPVGPFYTAEQAAAVREEGHPVIEDAGRGFRRVVASPRPRRVVEQAAIEAMLGAGVVVVAAGGGGIPVREEADGRLVGVEAVVDKDLASAVLANALGAQTILNLTAVDGAKLGFGRPDEQTLGTIGVADARRYLLEGHFHGGSMAPKIEAAIQFLENGGRRVVITLPERLVDGFEGRTGTSIVP